MNNDKLMIFNYSCQGKCSIPSTELSIMLKYENVSDKGLEDNRRNFN